MILMTLGTIPYQFDRAIIWLNILLEKGLISEPVFVQYGVSNISLLKNYSLVSSEPIVDSKVLISLMENARFVISHAGQGSTRLLASLGASFVLLPRLKACAEHIDDHQLGFAQAAEIYGIKHCLSFHALEQAVLNPPAPFQASLFDEPKLSQHLASVYQENF